MTPWALAVLIAAQAPDAGAAAPVVVHQQKTPFETLFVVDEGDVRALRFGTATGDDQSLLDRRAPDAVPMEYLRVAAASLAFTTGRTRALVIGVGGGTFPRLLLRAHPRWHVDAVDIDPAVLEVAERFFGLKPDRRLHTHAADGAAFMHRSDQRYDLILLDAYNADGVPEALATAAFFADVRARLRPGGVVVANIALGSGGAELRVARTFAAAFGACVMLMGAERTNLILLAKGAGLPAPARVRDRLRAFDREAQEPLSFSIADAVAEARVCP